MAHAEHEVFINRPRSEVFDFVVDGLNLLRWRPGIAELNLIAGRPDVPGATYYQLLMAPFGRRFRADYRLVELERNQKIVFVVIAGPLRPRAIFYFEVIGAGVLVRWQLEYHPKGLNIWKEPFAAWLLEKEVHNLDTLKEVLEQHYRPLVPPKTVS